MSSIRSFIPLQKLGEGTYSNVYKVRRVDDNEIYALKKVKLNSLTLKEKENSLNQVRILASIESTNIIAYKEAFFDQSLNVLCVVMEYANDGDLQKLIKTHTKSYKPIEQRQIWKAAQHILKGLQNLHSCGILHRDIKCANIFKSKGIYKLGDLNVSKVNGDKLAYTQTGTPYYASPEVWRDEPYDCKSDIWSFGCIIYEMAELRPPFYGKDMEDLFKNVQKAKVAPLKNNYSDQLWEFIDLCLQKDPKKRASVQQLLEYLKKHISNATRGIKVNNPQSNQLLKTIKVPQDLKKLNEALPTAKYRKSSQVVYNKRKQPIFSKLGQGEILGHNRSTVVLPGHSKLIDDCYGKKDSFNELKQPNHKIEVDGLVYIEGVNKKVLENKKIIHMPAERLNSNKDLVEDNRSNAYFSPKSKLQAIRLSKSPVSQMRLGKKVQTNMGHSQRQKHSDRKPSTASKVQRMCYQIQNDIKNLAQQLKKPISIPRTEKKPSLINNSHIVSSSYAQEFEPVKKNIENNFSYGPTINYQENRTHGYIIGQIRNNEHMPVDVWKNKLVKKNRILSSNQSKPSWW